jgi:hypothetical protein
MLDPADWEIARYDGETPLVAAVVDTEEEFDWGRPLATANTAVRAMRAQATAHRVFARYGVRPTYVVDWPVVDQDDGWRPLLELHRDGACEIGAHLHPWVNPPVEEEVCNANSYPGNLPAALERAKLARLAERIGERFGARPAVYKAGRYGVGPNTARILDELGFEVDASVVPGTDLRRFEGPDFTACGAKPYWFGRGRRLLEIPLSVAYVGALAPAGRRLYPRAASALGMKLHAPGVLARTRLLERITLTPEGVVHAEHRRLVKTMLAGGHRIFSFTYHSPSLVPGNTPYVASEAELGIFLDRFERFFDFFFGEIGGRPATLTEIGRLVAPPARTAAAAA